MKHRSTWLAALLAVALAAPDATSASATLEVHSILPTEATADEEVTIRGVGFGEGTRVALGGRPLSVRVLSSRTLRVIVPEGARSGRLVVERGGRVARSAELRVVRFHEPPVILSLAPEVVAPGGLVRVKGRGFGESNRALYVSVGGASAEVVERGRDALLVRVPAEAHSGVVIVVVARGGQAIAPRPVRIDESAGATAARPKPSAAP